MWYRPIKSKALQRAPSCQLSSEPVHVGSTLIDQAPPNLSAMFEESIINPQTHFHIISRNGPVIHNVERLFVFTLFSIRKEVEPGEIVQHQYSMCVSFEPITSPLVCND